MDNIPDFHQLIKEKTNNGQNKMSGKEFIDILEKTIFKKEFFQNSPKEDEQSFAA